MTNEPRAGDGEELVEADLPGREESDSASPEASAPEVDPLERIDQSVREWSEALDERAAERELAESTRAERERVEDDERFARGEPEPETADEVPARDFIDALTEGRVVPKRPSPPEEHSESELVEVDADERAALLNELLEQARADFESDTPLAFDAGRPETTLERTMERARAELNSGLGMQGAAEIDPEQREALLNELEARMRAELAGGPADVEFDTPHLDRLVEDFEQSLSDGGPEGAVTSVADQARGEEWVDIPQSALEDGDRTIDPSLLRPGKYHPDPLKDRTYLARFFEAPLWLKALVVGFAAAGGIVVVSLTGGLFGLGGSDEPATSLPVGAIEGTIVPTEAPSTATSAATAAAATATPAGVASGPPEGYTFCQVHPDEDELYCRPYYAPATSSNTLWPVRRYFERTVTFRAPIPEAPELPIEYRLQISGAAGPTIEHVLSGGPGEALSCVRLVDGSLASDGPNDVCARITAPDTLFMQIDLSAYGEGPILIEWFAHEIEPGDVLRGDYSNVDPTASLPAP